MRPRISHQPGDSWLHNLHPLVKLLWMILGTLGVFLIPDPWIALGSFTAVMAASLSARLKLRGLRGIRMFVVTAILLGVLQIIFLKEGQVALQIGPWPIYQSGLQSGLYITARFLFIVALSYLFVLSTSPNDLAYALMQAGLPYRYGFALITALRLVPVFEEEGQTVYQAQLARGVQYDRRSLSQLPTLARQFFFPMLVSALSKVDALAVSMEGRCFGKYDTRTFRRQVPWRTADTIAMLMLLILSIIFAWILLSR